MIFSCLILTLSLLISILTLSYGQKDLQSTATTGLSTSAGPMMTSSSSPSIPYAERQALSDLHDTTHGSKRNYVSSSAGAQRSINHPTVNPWANQAVSHEKGIL